VTSQIILLSEARAKLRRDPVERLVFGRPASWWAKEFTRLGFALALFGQIAAVVMIAGGR